VHAHHPEIQWVRGRHAPDAEQRHGNRDVRAFGQREHFPFGVRQRDAVTGEDERPLGGIDERDGVALLARASELKSIVLRFGEVRFGGLPVDVAAALLSILGDIHQYRAWPPRPGDRERFPNARGHVCGGGDQVVVLRDRQRDACDVGFLKRIRPDEPAAHLTSDAHDRRGVHHRRGDAGDHVGRLDRGGHRDADASARPA
jgi:hypothetical protein